MRTLANSPADILRQLLVDLGLGALASAASSLNWPVYFGGEPAAPDNCITIYDTTGVDSGRSMPTGERLGIYGLQFRVRATDSRVGWTKAHVLQANLAETIYQEIVTVSGIRYKVHALSKIGDVLPLGKDPSSARSLFTINAIASIKQL